jgi:hypothetical protein
MSRRNGLPALLLLSTLWTWVGFDVVCGAAIMPQLMPVITAPAHDGCCKQAADDSACATSPGCGLTCAALLTVMMTEADVEIVPADAALTWTSESEIAAVFPRCPPVPPPRQLA